VHPTTILGLTIALVILGSTTFGVASAVDVVASHEKITMNTVGKSDGKTIGFTGGFEVIVNATTGETQTTGDLFGYKITNMGDLDSNGAEDFATIAFEGNGTGYNEQGVLHQQLGTAYLVLMNNDSTVKESHELSNCAANDSELRETRTFGENLDYLGVIDGKDTLLIADYWFSKIHVLSIDAANNYSHTCSTITVSGLDDLAWPFTVLGNIAVDGDLNSVPSC